MLIFELRDKFSVYAMGVDPIADKSDKLTHTNFCATDSGGSL